MNITMRTWAGWLAGAVLAYATFDGLAHAQDRPAGYPSRPIRLVVTVAAGAGSDAIARAVGQMLTEAWDQTIVVDNRPGASGVIAMDLVAKAAPDGYTLLFQGDTTMLLGAQKRVPFDIREAYDPIVATSTQPYILLTGFSLPVKSIREMIGYSKTKQLTYAGSSGIGSGVHLGMERFARLSGAKLLYVPYKGSAPSIIGLMSGEIDMALGSSIAASAAIRTGKVKALATTGEKRIAALPDLPTVAEQGFPGFKITNRYNIYAPAGTSRAIITAINRVVSDGMYSPQMVKRLAADGSEPAERMTPTQLRKTVAEEYAEIEQMVKELNIKL